MINPNDDRTNIFGASDTKYMMMGLNTAGFKKFWLEKIGEIEPDFVPNKYTIAGSLLEEPILYEIDYILYCEDMPSSNVIQPIRLNHMYRNEKISCKEYPKLVVNLDGRYYRGIGWYDSEWIIYEVKTSAYENVFLGSVSSERDYIKQVNVQMFATGCRKAYIVYYGMLPSEYEAEFLIDPKIDPNRIKLVEVKYDEKFIDKYIKRLEFLSDCIDKNVYPWEV